MDLASYLLKPVQRMGKYALLLQQLMKASRQDVPDLRDAEKMVRFQLRHGNDLLAMDSLRDCDVSCSLSFMISVFYSLVFLYLLRLLFVSMNENFGSVPEIQNHLKWNTMFRNTFISNYGEELSQSSL